MELSKDTIEILEFLDFATGKSLRKRNDLGVILEIGAKFGEDELLSEILLKASSLRNIKQTIARTNSNTEGIEKLKSELNQFLVELSNLLSSLISDEIPEITQRFENIYLNKSQGSFKNLLDLSYDLSELNNVMKKIREK